MRSAVGLSPSTQRNERFRTFMENNHAAEYERQQVTDSLLYSSKVGHWEKMVKRNLHPWTCVNFYYTLKAYIVLTFYAEKNQFFQHKSSRPQLIRTKFGYLPVGSLEGSGRNDSADYSSMKKSIWMSLTRWSPAFTRTGQGTTTFRVFWARLAHFEQNGGWDESRGARVFMCGRPNPYDLSVTSQRPIFTKFGHQT